MKTSQILKRALAKIKSGWCQKESAKNKKGEAVFPSDKSAAKFCAIGALECVTNTLDHRAFDPAKNILAKVVGCVGGIGIVNWNDAKKRTQKQVIVAFEKAIKIAEKAEKK